MLLLSCPQQDCEFWRYSLEFVLLWYMSSCWLHCTQCLIRIENGREELFTVFWKFKLSAKAVQNSWHELSNVHVFEQITFCPSMLSRVNCIKLSFLVALLQVTFSYLDLTLHIQYEILSKKSACTTTCEASPVFNFCWFFYSLFQFVVSIYHWTCLPYQHLSYPYQDQSTWVHYHPPLLLKQAS